MDFKTNIKEETFIIEEDNLPQVQVINTLSDKNMKDNRNMTNTNKCELTPLLDRNCSNDITGDPNEFYKNNKSFDRESNDRFFSAIKEIRIAIEYEILPEIVYQGSSGSYFVRNSEKSTGIEYKSEFHTEIMFRVSRNESFLLRDIKKSRSELKNNFCVPFQSKVQDIYDETRSAIIQDILPVLCDKGSSGSYFTRNEKFNVTGIFKPRDEEPYGHLNPKWTKYLQKKICPCCFGRTCLIKNRGYLSEVAASLIDMRLDLNIVPPTRCVRIASKSFNYSAIDKAKSRTKRNIADRLPDLGQHFHRIGLPPKIGSLQQFVVGYEDADCIINQIEDDKINSTIKKKFKTEFEKLVILDYIIRNTDRTNSNWLIKYKPPSISNAVSTGQIDVVEDDSPTYTVETNYSSQAIVDEGEINIAAIDNGLAFPYKHPDAWRTYPYYWSWLKTALEPFSEETCQTFIPLLSNEGFVQSLIDDLRSVFIIDNHFEERNFCKQMAVMRGQIKNLVKAMETRKSPNELTQMALIVIETTKHKNENRFTQRFNMRNPFFSWC